MKKVFLYFVSGVSGVGKTATLTQLKKLLPEQYDVRDLDERGVPDGGGPEWLATETRHWVDIANDNSLQGITTVVCGFANPEVFLKIHKETDVPALLVLLDARGETIQERLLGRYPTKESEKEIERASGTTLESFVENCVSFAPKLRKLFDTYQMPVVETDTKTPEEVGREVATIITREG